MSHELAPVSYTDTQKDLHASVEAMLHLHLSTFARQINDHTSNELRGFMRASIGEPSVAMPHLSNTVRSSDKAHKKPQANDKSALFLRRLGRRSSHPALAQDLKSSDGRPHAPRPTTLRRLGRCSVDSVKHQESINNEEDGPDVACSSNGKLIKVLIDIVQSNVFEDVVTVVIFLNAIYIGVASDYMARHVLNAPPLVFIFAEYIFLAFFVFEIGLRIFVYRLNLFKRRTLDGKPNKTVYWHFMDAFVVFAQLAEVILQAAGSNVFETNITVLRLLRVVRLVRIVRLLNVLHFVRDLRAILYSITKSVSLFLWASVALFLLVYIWGIYFTELALNLQLRSSNDLPAVKHYFGNLPRTVLSLIMAVTGGVDWCELTDALGTVTSTIALVLYVNFALLAVMNVITGVFLGHALERAKEEHEVFLMSKARRIFNEVDYEENGMITWEDFRHSLNHRTMREFFEAIDIDISEAKNLFDLLDTSRDGCVSSEEFLDGCVRLRGAAKALDLLVLSREVAGYFGTDSEKGNSMPLDSRFTSDVSAFIAKGLDRGETANSEALAPRDCLPGSTEVVNVS